MNRIALSLALVATLAACTSDPAADPVAPKTSIAVASAGELTVELLSDGPLSTGLTPVYLKISNAAGPVTDATVTFTPVMAMLTGTSHGCPLLGAPTLDAEGLYRLDVVFNMASGDLTGSWSATVGVTRPAAALVEVEFPLLTVTDSGSAKPFSYTNPDTAVVTKYISSLNFVSAPRVGLNPVIVTLHRMDGAMVFTGVDDATLVLDPQMPSMGHGSPGSVNPTITSVSGVYAGELSFSMAGEWETTLTVSIPGFSPPATPKFTTFF